MIRDLLDDFFGLSLIVGGIAFIVGLLALLVWASMEERRACERAGGHIVSKPTMGVGVTGGGNVAMTSGSVSFCVSADGRIIE